MYNSDIDTTQKMRKLEKELKQLYSDAYARLTAESERYFDEFEDRYEKQYEAYRQGKYTKQEFDAWYMNQVARGERWEALRDDMAKKITNANVEAAKLINGTTPDVFLTNYNWSAYEAEKASGIAFNIYNQSAVDELMKTEPELLPKKGINVPKDLEWNKKKLSNAVVSGILTGKGINQISSSFQQVTDMNWAAAVRNARTAVTSAQNAGRQKNMEDVEEFAKAKGLKTQKEWVSAHDGRVRDSHAELDGVRVDIDEKFPNGLLYPADSNGAPAEVYNCRCAQRLVIDGVVAKRTDKTKASYQKWQAEKLAEQAKEKAARKAGLYDIMYEAAEGTTYRDYYNNAATVNKLWKSLPQKMQISLNDTKFVLCDKQGCRTSVADATIYLSKNAKAQDIYHELGHLVEAKMVPLEDVIEYRKSLLKGVKPSQIRISHEFVDTTGKQRDIFVIDSDHFISKYQSRIYAEKNPLEAVLPDGTINYEYLGDAFSVPFERYMMGRNIPEDIKRLIEGAIL